MKVLDNHKGNQALTVSHPTLIPGPAQINRLIQTTAGGGTLSLYNVSGYTAGGSPAFLQAGNTTAGSIAQIDYPFSNGAYIIPGAGQIIEVVYTSPVIMR